MQVNRCFGCMEETTSNPCPYCGYLHQGTDPQGYALQPGTILRGKYLIGSVLGQGGFGITYIGLDIALARKVAIKEYFPSAYVSRDIETSTTLQWYPTEQAQDARNMGREIFLKEARKMNRVDSIPQVVHVQDMFEDNDTAYIVMNYIPGENLAKKINRTGPMDWQSVRDLVLPVAEVMQLVHDAGLIHRDLSPDNLMIQPDGSTRILDLGAAKDINLHNGASSMQVAKGGFSPMEQYVLSGKSGPWTDVYSLAATAYFALTGIVPPSAVDRMDKDTLRWNLPQLRKVPDSVIHTLQMAMAIQGKDRIQSMRDFAAGLRQSSSGGKRRKLFAGIAAAVLAAVVLLSVLGKNASTEISDEPTAPEETVSIAAEKPTQENDAPQTSGEPWADNVLMATIIPSHYEYDAGNAPVFNSHIARYQITHVKFLDTLADVSSDSWDVSHARDGSVMAWVRVIGKESFWIDGDNVDTDVYTLYIAAEDGINGKYCAHLFDGFENVTGIDFNGAFHTDYAESMEKMFYGCYDLGTLDVSSFDTSNVTNMSNMFAACNKLLALDLRNFNTSKVTNMNSLFSGASALRELDISSFDTSNVTDMSNMFSSCRALKTLDLDHFNTAKVTNMSSMFSSMKLTDMDLSHFNTSRVTSISYMFSYCESLQTLNVKGWDTSHITNMNGVFRNCTNLNNIRGLTDWDTSAAEYHSDFMDSGFKVNGQPWEKLFQ